MQPTIQSEFKAQSYQTDDDFILQIKDLQTFFFLERGIVQAVNSVSLDLTRGSTLGIVGESGCGKSVTARSIMRIVQSPPGKIVDGEILFHRNGNSTQAQKETIDLVQLDAKGPEMRAIRGREIAMIFQEPMTSLNPLMTIGRQIAESVELHQNVSQKEALDRAQEMLGRVRISDPAQRLVQYPHQLSGGMRQRVMIALALSCNPSILIADEPTTALDVTVQAQILDLMRDLQRDFGSAIILITHNLGVVSQMADHIAVMYMGKVVEYGDVRQIFHEPLHPYTVGLLNSIPILGQKSTKALVPIEGMVPNPTEEIHGCAFASRCPHVMDICRTNTPPLKQGGTSGNPGHEVACWLHE